MTKENTKKRRLKKYSPKIHLLAKLIITKYTVYLIHFAEYTTLLNV